MAGNAAGKLPAAWKVHALAAAATPGPLWQPAAGPALAPDRQPVRASPAAAVRHGRHGGPGPAVLAAHRQPVVCGVGGRGAYRARGAAAPSAPLPAARSRNPPGILGAALSARRGGLWRALGRAAALVPAAAAPAVHPFHRGGGDGRLLQRLPNPQLRLAAYCRHRQRAARTRAHARLPERRQLLPANANRRACTPGCWRPAASWKPRSASCRSSAPPTNSPASPTAAISRP